MTDVVDMTQLALDRAIADAVRLIRKRVRQGYLPERDGELLARVLTDPSGTKWNWQTLKEAHFAHVDLAGEEWREVADEVKFLVWLTSELLSVRRDELRTRPPAADRG